MVGLLSVAVPAESHAIRGIEDLGDQVTHMNDVMGMVSSAPALNAEIIGGSQNLLAPSPQGFRAANVFGEPTYVGGFGTFFGGSPSFQARPTTGHLATGPTRVHPVFPTAPFAFPVGFTLPRHSVPQGVPFGSALSLRAAAGLVGLPLNADFAANRAGNLVTTSDDFASVPTSIRTELPPLETGPAASVELFATVRTRLDAVLFLHFPKYITVLILVQRNRVNCGNPKRARHAWQSAAKPEVHLGKVQRLPEGYSPLNDRLERPAPPQAGNEIVHPLTKVRTRSTENQTNITIDVHKAVAFRIEKIVDVFSNIDLRNEYILGGAYSLKRSVDVAIADLFDGFSQTVGTLAIGLTDDERLQAMQELLDENVPFDNPDDLTWALSPKEFLTNWLPNERISNMQYGGGNSVMKDARLAQVYGATTFVSTTIEGDKQVVLSTVLCWN